MKKIFLSLFALIAMVGMVNAQRVWAYGLKMSVVEETYTFEFSATTAATSANLVFLNADGSEAGKVALQNVVAGANTVTLTPAEIPGEGTLNWAVELAAGAITEVTKLTDDSKYNGFWFAYGVGVNTNPESEYFGNIYVSNPRHSSEPAQTGFYKYSPELVLDSTLFVDGSRVGYKPANVTLANAVDAIQRVAVSPVDGTVAFVQWNAAPFAAYGMNPANLAGEAVNLTEGINQPVALCYDNEGSLCVLSYDGKENGVSVYALYIIKDGENAKFFSKAGWVAGGYCEIASDGQGGFYVMSGALNTSNVVTSAKLQHISKKGEIDLTVLPGGEELAEAPATFNRLRLAYDLKRNVLAIGGGKKVNLYNAAYDAETGAPTLTKWTATSELTTNIDGIAFDYAGDLYVVSAGTETFYKFALPTNNNTCTTPAASKYAITVESTNPSEPEYDLEEEVDCPDLKITDIEEEGVRIFIVKGRDDEQDSSVELCLKNYTGEDGEYEVDLAKSFLTFGGVEVTLTAGTIAQTTDELGQPYYTGLVVGIAEDEGEEFTIALDITMYKEEAEGPDAEVYYDNITNMQFDLETMTITGGPSSDFQIEVTLGLGEDKGNGSFAISQESSIYIGMLSAEATLIEGVAYGIDPYAPEAKVDLVVTCGESVYQFHLDMSAAPLEATVVVVENANIEIKETEIFTGMYESSLKMTGTWTDAEGLEYPVSVEVPVYYPEATEPSTILSTVTVGSLEEGANWLGFGEGELTIETVDGVVTATGVVKHPDGSLAIDITISGKVPQGPTGVENNTINVKAVKVIRDGQLVIRNNGVEFNAQGAVVK